MNISKRQPFTLNRLMTLFAASTIGLGLTFAGIQSTSWVRALLAGHSVTVPNPWSKLFICFLIGSAVGAIVSPVGLLLISSRLRYTIPLVYGSTVFGTFAYTWHAPFGFYGPLKGVPFAIVWVIMSAGATFIVAAVVNCNTKYKYTADPQCASCGYSLRGNASEKCPECGASK